MTDNIRAEKTYLRLFEKISRIHESTSGSQLKAYWETGKYLEELASAFPARAGYGQNYIVKMSEDLTKKFGKGFSVTSLKDMRTFYSEYPKSRPVDFLDWSKMILLIRIKDRNIRDKYIQKTLDESLNREELKNLISVYRLRQRDPESLKATDFPVERGSLYRYRLAEVQEPGEEKSVTIDCGFNVWRRVFLEDGESLRDSEIFSVEKKGNKYCVSEVFADSLPERKQLYTYRAEIERIIDGDTLWLQVDAGFGTTVRQKIRLRGIDTPEMAFNEGKKAKGFVQRQLSSSTDVVIKTYKTDKYDRYLADLFYLKGEDDPQIICTEGELLNRNIVLRGYGRRV